jgi:hypothetical protein
MIDKSTWGPGLWQNEPDRAEWRHAGFPCLAVRNARFGNWCGYVGVPPDHSEYAKGYSEYNFDVHGGLTYAGACNGHICHVPEPGEPEHVWWFGFDCGHYMDFAPGVARWHERDEDETYRDLAYVTAETNRLAEQLASVTAP